MEWRPPRLRPATPARLSRLRPASAAGWALAAALAAGVALRVLALAGTWPAILAMHDTAGYVRAARRGLVWSAQEPSGYPLFLRALHAIASQLALVTVTQHLLGLAAGCLIYAAMRRMGAGRWIALVPAAVIWLNGDELFLEQTPLSETLFIFLLSVAVYAIARTREDGGAVLWPALAAAASAALLSVRSIGAALLPVLAVFLLIALLRRRGATLRPLIAAVAVGVVVLAAYAGVRHHATGSWSVGVQGTGWNLYARAATFADCRDFKPPSGTRALCESTPPARRPGPGIYHWYPNSPAIRAFGEPPRRDRQVGEFALAAIEHQPLDYADAIFTDVIRYADPQARHPKLGDGAGGSSLSFARASDTDLQAGIEARAYYAPVRLHTWGAAALRSYQSVLRVHGWLVALLFALALAGVAVARRGRRWAILLLFLAALDLLVFPAAVGGATWRYAIPADGLLAGAAALGAVELFERMRALGPLPRRAAARAARPAS